MWARHLTWFNSGELYDGAVKTICIIKPHGLIFSVKLYNSAAIRGKGQFWLCKEINYTDTSLCAVKL